MNLRQVRYFCEVVDAGSAAMAAEKLFVAPTAISMQISLLETDLGGVLFDRKTRPMELTELGKFFYPRAKTLLAQTHRLEEETKGVAEGRSGWLGIGFVRSTIFSILPSAIRAFRETHPDVKLDLIELLSEYQPEQLRQGRIHVGVSRFIGAYDRHADIQYHVLLEDPFVVALHRNHPLATKASISSRDLAGEHFIIYPKDPLSNFGRQVMTCLGNAGTHVKVAHEAIEIHTALALVAAGLGWTLVGGSIQHNNRNDIVFIPIDDIDVTTTVVAMTRVDEDSRLVSRMLDALAVSVPPR